MSDQLKAISYTDERAKEIVKKFCDHVHRLVGVRHTFTVLFEDEQPSCRTLMEKTASSFFAELNKILQEYLLLECAKITDPATTGNYENFTVDYLVQKIIWPNEDILKELQSLQSTIEGFRRYIKPARDKLLAHQDKSAVLSGETFGAFPEAEGCKFFDALQKMCNIAHEACFGTIYGNMSPIGCGDVFNLINTLRQAIAFDVALSESSGQNKTWLLMCLDKAGHEAASH